MDSGINRPPRGSCSCFGLLAGRGGGGGGGSGVTPVNSRRRQEARAVFFASFLSQQHKETGDSCAGNAGVCGLFFYWGHTHTHTQGCFASSLAWTKIWAKQSQASKPSALSRTEVQEGFFPFFPFFPFFFWPKRGSCRTGATVTSEKQPQKEPRQCLTS